MRKRDNSIIKNVDFTRLNEILEEKHIRKAELSRKCGYDSDYVSQRVFREKKLNWTVAETLEKEYGISPDEYSYEKAEVTTSDNDTYKYMISFNGELLKSLALASINEHMSIEDFILDCILKCIN